MNRINTTWSQQAATVPPSPPAVVPSGNSTSTARQTPQDVSVEIRPAIVAQQLVPKQQNAQQPRDSIEAMKAAAQQIESYLRSIGRALEFSIDDSTGRTVVTVRDSATGDTIRQIPSEEALRLAHTLGNQSSALIDTVV